MDVGGVKRLKWKNKRVIKGIDGGGGGIDGEEKG